MDVEGFVVLQTCLCSFRVIHVCLRDSRHTVWLYGSVGVCLWEEIASR